MVLDIPCAASLHDSMSCDMELCERERNSRFSSINISTGTDSKEFWYRLRDFIL